MTLETFKSFVLAVLVGLSLIMTYSLWTFQPNYDRYKSNLQYVNEVDLGGDLVTKKSVVRPSSIILHEGDKVFGFKEAEIGQELFSNLQEHTLTNMVISGSKTAPGKDFTLEISFPESLPLEVIKSLFVLENPEATLPHWPFNTIYYDFNEDDNQIGVRIISTDEAERASFVIESTKAMTELWSVISKADNIVDYFLVEDLSPKIYLPEKGPGIQARTLAIEGITSSQLIDALFSNPALVSPNVGEGYFTDGQRGMRVLNDQKSIEYINPIQSSYDRIEKLDLLDMSINKINDHAGWTNDFYLDTIVSSVNQVIYRMHYDDYPIFHQGDLTIIDHQWRQNDVYKYKRPIFYLKSSFGGNNVSLPSGRELITYLRENLEENIQNVRGIRVGYNLVYLESEPYSVNLEPAWFMNYNGQWQTIRIIDPDYEEGGV